MWLFNSNESQKMMPSISSSQITKSGASHQQILDQNSNSETGLMTISEEKEPPITILSLLSQGEITFWTAKATWIIKPYKNVCILTIKTPNNIIESYTSYMHENIAYFEMTNGVLVRIKDCLEKENDKTQILIKIRDGPWLNVTNYTIMKEETPENK